MAKWFKEFPINLRNGTDRIRSASESGSQPRTNKAGLAAGTKATSSKASVRKNSSSTTEAAGGGPSGSVGSILSGRNRKNSATEVSSRNGAGTTRDGKIWDGLLSGKKKNLKAEEQHRPLQKSPSANSYMSRLIRVDKQDKSPNFHSSTGTSIVGLEAEKTSPCRTETVSSSIQSGMMLSVLVSSSKYLLRPLK